MDGQPYNPRTVEEIFRDYEGRRAGLIKALTIDFEEFHRMCYSEKEKLYLFGSSSQDWKIVFRSGELPTTLPLPVSGINFARDRMQEKDWRSFVAVHSDTWLLALAFHYGARSGINKADRERLFGMINDLPTISKVVASADIEIQKRSVKRQKEEQSSVSSSGSIGSESNSKVESNLKSQPEDKKEGLDEEDEEEHGENSSSR